MDAYISSLTAVSFYLLTNPSLLSGQNNNVHDSCISNAAYLACSLENFEKFLTDFFDGKLTPYLKSEAVPDNSGNAVKVSLFDNNSMKIKNI